MKEELIRVLNVKLDDTNANIDSLNELNKKIDEENEKLAYVKKVLGLFKTEEGYNILNFVKLNHDDFDKIVKVVLKDDTIFNTDSCNYDGLIYLINGINNGVSLSLTEEQKNSIEYLIRGLKSRAEEYDSTLEGLNLVKERFPISNLDVLNSDKARFEKLLDNINNQEYIDDTDLLKETFEFNNLDNNEIISLLSYVLNYNAEIYALKNNDLEEDNHQDYQKNTSNEEFAFHEFNKSDFEIENKIENDNEDVFYVKPLNEEHNENKNIEADEADKEIKIENEDNHEIKLEEQKEVEEIPSVDFELPSEGQDDLSSYKLEENDKDLYETNETIIPEIGNQESENVAMPFEVNNFEKHEDIKEQTEEIPSQDEYDEVDVTLPISEPEETHSFEEITSPVEIIPEVPAVDEKIDSEFADIGEDYEDTNSEEEMSSKKINEVLTEYNIQNSLVNTNELIVGDIKKYRNILELLKDNNILNEFSGNKELFTKIMTSSTDEDIRNILKVIKEDLSVDDEDYEITLKIVINTIPSIFIKDGGNYDNFMKNIELFKSLDINLINLFDFSKEVLVANNNQLVNNLEIIKDYKVNLNYSNAKYLLLLPNIAERMDYYIESVYKDKNKNEVFDGIDFINNYAVKLNVVTPLTIKRLRFASENGNKIFGSKPYSLSGEITNLKVNALEISDAYLNNFFDNQFDGITSEEVRQYVKLIRNTSNVGNYIDELDKLEKYHKGMRYVIGNINVSYNKVIRNYNILRSYGVNNNKALHFAICYNLIITKDEYSNLKKELELGGNA